MEYSTDKLKRRNCGNCNMCCKLPEINFKELKKKSFEWCKHCEIGVGCKIYDTRPKGCRKFYCFWQEGFSELKPNKVGFFIFAETFKEYQLSKEEFLKNKILTIYAEPQRVDKIPQLLMKDKHIYNLIDQGWAFHIRFSNDDKEIYIFDLKEYGMELKKITGIIRKD